MVNKKKRKPQDIDVVDEKAESDEILATNKIKPVSIPIVFIVVISSIFVITTIGFVLLNPEVAAQVLPKIFP